MRRSNDWSEWTQVVLGLMALCFWMTFLIHAIRAEKWVILVLGLFVPPFGAGYGLLFALGIVP